MADLPDLFDAVNWQEIPAHPRAVMGYLDGPRSAWPAAGWNHFAATPHVVVTVLANPRAQVFDSESGNAPVFAVATAAAARYRAGTWSTIYCNRSSLGGVVEACRGAQVPIMDASHWPAPGVYLHIADPTGRPHLVVPGTPVQPVAVQWGWYRTYDRSACFETYPILPGPAKVTPAQLTSGVVAIAAHPSGGGYWLARSDGAILTHGTAPYYGSMGGHPLGAPVADLAVTPAGDGYWLVGSDGGVFNFGGAHFAGAGL